MSIYDEYIPSIADLKAKEEHPAPLSKGRQALRSLPRVSGSKAPEISGGYSDLRSKPYLPFSGLKI
jgi:hypothetical protein